MAWQSIRFLDNNPSRPGAMSMAQGHLSAPERDSSANSSGLSSPFDSHRSSPIPVEPAGYRSRTSSASSDDHVRSALRGHSGVVLLDVASTVHPRRVKVTPDLSQPFGITLSGNTPPIISTVETHSIAYKAGLRSMDRLLAINGVSCANSNHHEAARMLKQAMDTTSTSVSPLRRKGISRKQQWRHTIDGSLARPSPPKSVLRRAGSPRPHKHVKFVRGLVAPPTPHNPSPPSSPVNLSLATNSMSMESPVMQRSPLGKARSVQAGSPHSHYGYPKHNVHARPQPLRSQSLSTSPPGLSPPSRTSITAYPPGGGHSPLSTPSAVSSLSPPITPPMARRQTAPTNTILAGPATGAIAQEAELRVPHRRLRSPPPCAISPQPMTRHDETALTQQYGSQATLSASNGSQQASMQAPRSPSPAVMQHPPATATTQAYTGLSNADNSHPSVATDAYSALSPPAPTSPSRTDDGELFLGFQVLDEATGTDSPSLEMEDGVRHRRLEETGRQGMTDSPTLAPAKQLFGFDAEIDEDFMRQAAEGSDVFKGFESFSNEDTLETRRRRSENHDGEEEDDLASFGWHLDIESQEQAADMTLYPETVDVYVYQHAQPWRDNNADKYNPVVYTSPKVVSDYPAYGDPESTLLLTFNNSGCDEDPRDRSSICGAYDVVDNMPRNPLGRYGIQGRGNLSFWGPNYSRHNYIIIHQDNIFKIGKAPQTFSPAALPLPVSIGRVVPDPRSTDNAWVEEYVRIDPASSVHASTKLLALTTVQPGELDLDDFYTPLLDEIKHACQALEAYVAAMVHCRMQDGIELAYKQLQQQAFERHCQAQQHMHNAQQAHWTPVSSTDPAQSMTSMTSKQTFESASSRHNAKARTTSQDAIATRASLHAGIDVTSSSSALHASNLDLPPEEPVDIVDEPLLKLTNLMPEHVQLPHVRHGENTGHLDSKLSVEPVNGVASFLPSPAGADQGGKGNSSLPSDTVSNTGILNRDDDVAHKAMSLHAPTELHKEMDGLQLQTTDKADSNEPRSSDVEAALSALETSAPRLPGMAAAPASSDGPKAETNRTAETSSEAESRETLSASQRMPAHVTTPPSTATDPLSVSIASTHSSETDLATRANNVTSSISSSKLVDTPTSSTASNSLNQQASIASTNQPSTPRPSIGARRLSPGQLVPNDGDKADAGVPEWVTRAKTKRASFKVDSLNAVKSQHTPEEVVPEWVALARRKNKPA
eukprot:TRINITY_DN11827_c0_g1_i1.p1 TRINITY_DN11827_c0_g1~~TRINITY_DN11827_c0_g1_i1.p1  ORF type:complete len:1224 (+),score=253.70 TRINITY_DN11827_c0_g1_i1:100-3771(+)